MRFTTLRSVPPSFRLAEMLNFDKSVKTARAASSTGMAIGCGGFP